MNSFLPPRPFFASLLLSLVLNLSLRAADEATLVAHWPLDEASNGSTPDVAGAADMELVNLTAQDLVTGRRGQAFAFDANRETLLARTHQAGDPG